MGIKGLKKIIKKNAPNSFTEIRIKDLKGSKIGVDSSILLYKFRYTYKDDNFHILGFLNKTIELLENKITPIFVFDGKPPNAKKSVIDSRIENRNKMKERLSELMELKKELPSEEFIDSDDEESIDYKELIKINKEIEKIQRNNLIISRNHSIEVMELLESLGVNFLIANGEAEEYCAFLQKKQIVDFVLTEDTDSLTFGCSKVIFNTKNNFSICCLENILSSLGITYLQFIDFCILSGCDYTCTIPKIGQVTALNIIKKYGTIESFISNNKKYVIPEDFNYLLARDLFLANENFKVPDIKKNKLDKEKFKNILEKHKINNSSISFFVNKLIKLI